MSLNIGHCFFRRQLACEGKKKEKEKSSWHANWIFKLLFQVSSHSVNGFYGLRQWVIPHHHRARYSVCFPLLVSLTISGLGFLEVTLLVHENYILGFMWIHPLPTCSWFLTAQWGEKLIAGLSYLCIPNIIVPEKREDWIVFWLSLPCWSVWHQTASSRWWLSVRLYVKGFSAKLAVQLSLF